MLFVPVCNATLVEEAGSIKSPNYPEEYDNNLDCTLWLNTNGIVTIDVKDFRLEEDSEW